MAGPCVPSFFLLLVHTCFTSPLFALLGLFEKVLLTPNHCSERTKHTICQTSLPLLSISFKTNNMMSIVAEHEKATSIAYTNFAEDSRMLHQHVGRNKAIAMNNLGVDHLEIGDHRQAFHLFHHALSHVMDDESQTLGMHEQVQQQQQQQLCYHQHLPRQPGSSCLSPMLQGYDSSKSSFHSQGLRIDSTRLYFPTDPQANDAVCCSIIIFNLAMTLHVKAMDDGESGIHRNHNHVNQKFLLKAKTLYDKCHELLTNHHVTMSQHQYLVTAASSQCCHQLHQHHQTHPMVDILHMALLTNLAQLNLELVEYRSFEQYRCELIRYIHSITVVLPLSIRYCSPSPTLSSQSSTITRDVVNFMEQQTGHYLLNSNILLTMTETARPA